MGTRTPERTRAAGALAAYGLLAAAAATVIGLVAVGTRAGQELDDAGRGGVSAFDEPIVVHGAGRLLDTISVASLALLGAAIVTIALLRGRPRLAAAAGVVLIGANVTTQVVKGSHERADLVYGWWTEAGSYPSGHTTVAMSLAMALMIVVPPAVRWTAALGGCCYAAGVGVAVISLDWHRPSEVVGAYLVVVAWAALAMAAVTLLTPDADREPEPAGRAAGWVAGAAAVAFAAVFVFAAARRLDLRYLVDDHTAFAVAAAISAAACAVLGAITTALVQRASRAEPSAAIVPRDARRHPDGRG